MSDDDHRLLTKAQAMIRALQEELSDADRGMMALDLELEKRIEQGMTDLSQVYAELERTNSELLQLTLDLENRVAQRTVELQAKNEILRQQADLLQQVHDTILVKDMNKCVIYWNRGAESMYGWTAADARGRNPDMLLKTAFPRPLEEIEAELQEKGLWEGELERTRRDGARLVVASRWGLMHDESGRSTAVMETDNDVTGRKHAEEQIVRLNKDLEQRVCDRTSELKVANAELEAFSYSVSHDLRTPLRAINGFAQILLKEYVEILAEKPRHYLQMVCDNARQMGQLIDDLLRFSRTSRQVLRVERVHPAALVRQCLEELQFERQGRRVEVQIGELPDCWADGSLLKQVWLNLISNALKFTRSRDPAHIEIGSMPYEGETAYYVRDNGAGFDMQYADKLFGVFQRLHATEEFEGTGIGLALLQRILHRHGGRAWAEAKIDQGAWFYFTLGRITSND